MIVDSLIDIGLTEKEAKLYVALLENGVSSPKEAAENSGINRTTAYMLLDELVEKGFVSSTDDGDAKKYQAESPDMLMSIVDARLKECRETEKIADEVVPTLHDMSETLRFKPTVRFFEGWSGIKSVFDEIATKTKGGSICALLPADTLDEANSDYEREFFERLTAQGTSLFAIQPVSDVPSLLPGHMKGTRHRVPLELFNIKSDVYIYGDYLALISIREEFGAIIQGDDVAVLMREIFSLAAAEAKLLQVAG
ncbi:MAG: helix-turn-helix domain-containing protein [Patescibacteria group bacterium]